MCCLYNEDEDPLSRECEDDTLEDLRNGTLVPSIDNSDLPMFDSRGWRQ